MGDAGGGFGNVTLMLVVDTALTVEPLGAVNEIGHFLSIVINFTLELQSGVLLIVCPIFERVGRFPWLKMSCVNAKPTCLFIH